MWPFLPVERGLERWKKELQLCMSEVDCRVRLSKWIACQSCTFLRPLVWMGCGMQQIRIPISVGVILFVQQFRARCVRALLDEGRFLWFRINTRKNFKAIHFWLETRKYVEIIHSHKFSNFQSLVPLMEIPDKWGCLSYITVTQANIALSCITANPHQHRGIVSPGTRSRETRLSWIFSLNSIFPLIFPDLWLEIVLPNNLLIPLGWSIQLPACNPAPIAQSICNVLYQ